MLHYSTTRWLIAMGCLLLLVPLELDATRDIWSDNFNDILYFIDQFAFEEGGTWEIYLDPLQKATVLSVLVCTNDQYNSMINGYSYSDGVQVCNEIAQGTSACPFYENISGYVELLGSAPTLDMYYFVLVNCNQTSLNMDFYEVFINPGNDYLGWNYIPLPYIYGFLIIIYSFLLVLWLTNIVLIDMGAGSNRLHKYISLWPIMKLFLVAFNAGYYGYIASEGVMSWVVDGIYVVYNAFWYCYLFGALLLIALAWGISRKSITVVQSIVLTLVELVFYVTWVINFIFDGYYTVASLLGLACMLATIFYYNYSSLRKVALALKQSQSADSTQQYDGSDTTPTSGAQLSDVRYSRSKLALEERHRILMWFVAIHIVFILLMGWWIVIYVWWFHFETWAYRLLNEGTELALAVVIGWLFRLRRRNIYFEFNDDALDDWEKRTPSADDPPGPTNQEDGVEMNSMSGYTSEEELPPIGHGEHNLSE